MVLGIITATVYVVWFYHSPAIARVETQQDTNTEYLRYIRKRVDDIYDRLPRKEESPD